MATPPKCLQTKLTTEQETTQRAESADRGVFLFKADRTLVRKHVHDNAFKSALERPKRLDEGQYSAQPGFSLLACHHWQ
jgi:hypothetical protein